MSVHACGYVLPDSKGGEGAARRRRHVSKDERASNGGGTESEGRPNAGYDGGAVRPVAVIGGNRLLRIRGESGHGIACLAEQQWPVALKVIQPGMDIKLVIGRFETDRQGATLDISP